MKRTADGFAARFRVEWRQDSPNGSNFRISRPCLMNWALEVAKRMRKRGHTVMVFPGSR